MQMFGAINEICSQEEEAALREDASAAASKDAIMLLSSAGVHVVLAAELAQPVSERSFMQAASLLLAHLMSVPPGNPGRRHLCECLRNCHRRAR